MAIILSTVGTYTPSLALRERWCWWQASCHFEANRGLLSILVIHGIPRVSRGIRSQPAKRYWNSVLQVRFAYHHAHTNTTGFAFEMRNIERIHEGICGDEIDSIEPSVGNIDRFIKLCNFFPVHLCWFVSFRLWLFRFVCAEITLVHSEGCQYCWYQTRGDKPDGKPEQRNHPLARQTYICVPPLVDSRISIDLSFFYCSDTKQYKHIFLIILSVLWIWRWIVWISFMYIAIWWHSLGNSLRSTFFYISVTTII